MYIYIYIFTFCFYWGSLGLELDVLVGCLEMKDWLQKPHCCRLYIWKNDYHGQEPWSIFRAWHHGAMVKFHGSSEGVVIK